MILGYVLNFCANVVFTFVAAHLLESIGQGKFDDIIFYATIEFLTVLSMRLFWGVSYYCYSKLQSHRIAGIQKDCNKKMFEISSPTYSSASSGVFLNRIVTKPAIAFKMFESILSSAMCVLTSVAVVGYIAFMDWALGLIIVAGLALSALLIYFHNKIQAGMYTRVDNAENEFNTTLLEAIRGARDVKCLNLQENIKKEMAMVTDKFVLCDTKARSAMIVLDVVEKLIILDVYDMSIKENLKLAKPDAPDVTDNEIADVVERAALKGFIDRLPYKLDTIIGENGLKLSGGQKQRLAIARAFLKDSKIVVFDESTSALDNAAQTYVQNSIDECEGKTVVIVAHRLSTIINVDKIYFLQNGSIVNSGTFDYLMNNDEAFKELFLTELA